MTQSVKPPGPWDDFAVRCIGVYKLCKAVGAIVCSIYLLSISHKNLPDLVNGVISFLQLSPEGRIVHYVVDYIQNHAGELTPFRIRLVAKGLIIYSIIFTIEGYGLFWKRTWGEYLVAVSTAIPLPFELYLMIENPGWFKILLITGNLAILGFLIHRLWEEHRLKGSLRPVQPDKADASCGAARKP